MKVLLTTPARFHTFALARELETRGHLLAVVTGFPHYKVRRENLPQARVKSFPLFTLLSLALSRAGVSARTLRPLEDVRRMAIDLYSGLWANEADVFIALSASGLRTGTKVKRRGGVYICDRGSTHILFQKHILEQEALLHGTPMPYFSSRVIEKELAEYEISDAITVPSEFVRQSFIQQGVSAEKVHKIPYGANTKAFFPTGTPDDEFFDVLFVGGLSTRKGLPYLFKAFEKLNNPRKRLVIAGMPTADFPTLRHLAPEGTRFLGHVPSQNLKALMSSSHVLMLPSVEEGLALVMAEALACGCPVIATENTGASDLFTDGVEGYIVPARDVEGLSARLQELSDAPDLRNRMSVAARERITSLGGWSAYGENMMRLLSKLTFGKPMPAVLKDSRS